MKINSPTSPLFMNQSTSKDNYCDKDRNAREIIVTRHRGAGHMRIYHKIDFQHNKKKKKTYMVKS